MTHRNSSSHCKLSLLRKVLIVGVALPALIAFTVSTGQAQISKSVTSKKPSFGATTSKSFSTSRLKSVSGNRISSSKSSRAVGNRSSRVSSFGTTPKPSSKVITRRPSGVSARSHTSSIGNAFQKPSSRSSSGGLTFKPGISKPSTSKPGSSLLPSWRGNQGSDGRLVPKPPSNSNSGDALRDLSSRIPGGFVRPPVTNIRPPVTNIRPPVTNIRPPITNIRPPGTLPPSVIGNNNGLGNDRVLGGGRKLPGNLGPAPGGQLGNLVGKMPKITENNRRFDNILENLGTANAKPLELEELRKELPKVMSPLKEKLATNSEQFKMLTGAKKMMSSHFGMGAHCHWWADLLCGWHWQRHGCHWVDICGVPNYWSCWTPCHYRVVWCPSIHGHVQTAWYFGIESFLIPDLCALGVHEVTPYSPAALAGLMPGDMILSVNGYALDSESVLPEMIQRSGGILNIEVYRDGLEAPVVVDVRLRRLRITTY